MVYGDLFRQETTEGDQESMWWDEEWEGGLEGGDICILTAGSCFTAETNITL